MLSKYLIGVFFGGCGRKPENSHAQIWRIDSVFKKQKGVSENDGKFDKIKDCLKYCNIYLNLIGIREELYFFLKKRKFTFVFENK